MKLPKFPFSLPALLLCGLCVLVAGLSGSAHAAAYDDFLFAVKFNDVRTVQNLLAKGMDANTLEAERGETVLMIALREKSMKVVELLLKHPEIKLEARAHNGDTALMLASYLGNRAAVTQLLDAGAEVNQPGWAALHYAAINGDLKIIALLLEHAAYIDAISPNKTTPLMMAVRSGKLAAVQLLLDEGADIGLINSMNLSALDFAIQLEQKEIASELRARQQAHASRPGSAPAKSD
ncbi:ankyrin repeat domain-containing protein [Undibacterium parvum]|uniref:Ankyrin repeat domain-containing protein n=1 Tax=Undibacterium parvum TaxID=401471 RepID=A0A3S9HND7_9BURK|nr:ankyrin repeat domain-containing protein [Undibacterium parvum]AZP13630.1 ankyrin repeat domain-containing protein [Undibacterium parvum]